MKAEQRKELETNALADKVGQAMQRVKGNSRRGVLIYFVAGIIILLAAYFTYRYWVVSKSERSLHWLMLDDGGLKHLQELIGENNKGTNPGKAARFQVAWLKYWDEGVRMIGADPQGSMQSINLASRIYEGLATDCADDPLFEPQAWLGIAVTEETRAVQDIESLAKAKQAYKKLVDHEKYADSAEGRFAKGRLDIMNNPKKFQELARAYEDMQKSLNVPGALPLGFPGIEGLPGGHPPIPKAKAAKDKVEKKT